MVRSSCNLGRASAIWERVRVYACSLLKSGYGLDPIEDGSRRWLLYYSGSSVADDGNTGLTYVELS